MVRPTSSRSHAAAPRLLRAFLVLLLSRLQGADSSSTCAEGTSGCVCEQVSVCSVKDGFSQDGKLTTNEKDAAGDMKEKKAEKRKKNVGEENGEDTGEIREEHEVKEEEKQLAQEGDNEIGEEEKVEEEEEEKVTAADLAIACMLIGGIVFQMTLFYLVNYPDADVVYYVWAVISSTLSIFSAVLIFQGIETAFDIKVVQFLSEDKGIAAKYLFMMVWWFALQVSTLVCSGLLRTSSSAPCADTKVMTSCCAELLAHMAGFASIGAGGALQQSSHLSSSPWLVGSVLPLHFALLVGLGFLRETWSDNVQRSCRHTAEFIAQFDLWCEQSAEAENDMTALSISFMIVQPLRFAITGILPNHHGVEIPQQEHSVWCTVALSSLGIMFAAIVVWLVIYIGNCTHGPKVKRFLEICQAIAAMAFAWCFLFAIKWEFKRMAPSQDPNSMTSVVLLALVTSGVGFVLIFTLDYLEDLESTGKAADKAIISIIRAIGMLVGFCWEQSFNEGVMGIASLLPYPLYSRLLLAAAISVVAVPAWKMYIIPKVLRAHALHLADSLERKASNSPKKRTTLGRWLSAEFQRESSPDMHALQSFGSSAITPTRRELFPREDSRTLRCQGPEEQPTYTQLVPDAGHQLQGTAPTQPPRVLRGPRLLVQEVPHRVGHENDSPESRAHKYLRSKQ
eukprot:gnl/TRDRNA2_/TRDRNA2_182760_c0_seq1.p1 gnl/TRDRNA2_/TRDRNA2_182760_c0~~gnl/TRDRNA2_/TRDRNA2_182760_c0_seq1.p1  ORF type:complete len:678 (-),score=128.85 gnl/TRDRNA2_/TRDRNA2_182760_c0_seq1:72-2105(-)